MDIHSLSQQQYSSDLPPNRKIYMERYLLQYYLQYQKIGDGQMFTRRGRVIETSRNPLKSTIVLFFFFVFLNEMWNSPVLTCRNLYYAHICPFPLLPSKVKVEKVVYNMLLLGKGKLRKCMCMQPILIHAFPIYKVTYLLYLSVMKKKKSVL